jgi:uncharacterized protein (TIGR00251 family)
MFYQSTKDGIIVHLKVTPNASKNEICDIIFGDFGKKLLRIRVKAVPDDGKANKELLKFLAKEWGIAQADMEIVSGKTARVKSVLVLGDVVEKLRELELLL